MAKYRDAGQIRPFIERLYMRHRLPDCLGAVVMIAGETYKIKEIAYGGFGTTPIPVPLEPLTEVSLEILGLEIRDRVALSHTMTSGAGFEFRHELSEVMHGLRSIVPFVEAGRSMAEADDDAAPRETPSDRLDPVAEAVLFGDPAGGGGEVRYRVGRVLHRLRVEAGELATWHDVHPGAVLEGLRKTSVPDPSIVRGSLLILSGLSGVFPGDQRIPELMGRIVDSMKAPKTHQRLSVAF